MAAWRGGRVELLLPRGFSPGGCGGTTGGLVPFVLVHGCTVCVFVCLYGCLVFKQAPMCAHLFPTALKTCCRTAGVAMHAQCLTTNAAPGNATVRQVTTQKKAGSSRQLPTNSSSKAILLSLLPSPLLSQTHEASWMSRVMSSWISVMTRSSCPLGRKAMVRLV